MCVCGVCVQVCVHAFVSMCSTYEQGCMCRKVLCLGLHELSLILQSLPPSLSLSLSHTHTHTHTHTHRDIKPEPSDSSLLANGSASSMESKRSHQCPECGKECGSPSKLATHIKTHSSDKPHKCTVQVGMGEG